MILKPSLKAKIKTAFWSLAKRPDYFLFFLLVVLLPAQLAYHFWPDWALVGGIRVDYLAPTIYLTDLLTVSLLIYWLVKDKPRVNNLFLVLFGFAIINVVFSLNPWVAVYKWLKFLEFGALSYYVFKNKNEVKKVLPWGLSTALLYTLVLASLQFFLNRTVGGPFYLLGERSFNVETPGIALVNIFGKNHLRPYATFPHPNVLGGFSLVAFLVGSTVGLPLVLFSFSAATVLTLVVTSLFKQFLKHICKQLLLGLVLVSLLLMPLGSYADWNALKFSESISKRFELAAIAGDAFATAPVVGVGLGNFISFIPKSNYHRGFWFLQPVHNIFLLVLAETGALGLSLFCYLLFRILKNSTENKNWRFGIALLAVLITGVVDHYWLTLQQTELLFAIVVGILI